tara:strand:- start:112 stop:1362 length:1251 start_codon:yes stop_codon:yes gene_type:complete
MNWIDINKKNSLKIIVVLICTVVLINKFTLSFFDPTPPLSKTAIYLMYLTYIGSVVGTVIFYYYRNFFIQLTITLIFLISIDLITNLFIERTGHKEFRMQQPQPYVNAGYFSKDFINEAFTQPGGWLLDKTYGGVKPRNFEGKWINVRNNRRVTINEPGNYLRKIYLFGGSTVYNAEVPDALTIASQLASLGANDFSYKVVNMGATSIHSAQQFGRLKSEIKLKDGDVVIFYDGVNDVMQRIVYENSEGYMVGKPNKESFWIKQLRSKSDNSSILHIFHSKIISNTKETSSTLIKTSIEDYIKTLITANKYVEAQGAYFYHFLQPTLFTKKNLNKYEQMLLAKGPPFVPAQVILDFTKAYPIISNRLDSVIFSYSLIGAFDDLVESPYLDFCHVTHVGNKVIAENIWNSINEELKF